MTFPRKQLNQPFIYRATKQRPFLFFGLPLITSIVGGSFALSHLTQTRYDLHESKTKKVDKEEELQLSSNKRLINLQEEYIVRNKKIFKSKLTYIFVY